LPKVSFEASGRHPERHAPVTFLLFVLAPLVVFLGILIYRMNHVEHYTPQAYYRKKRGGAPVAEGFESLGPRARKSPPSEDGDVPRWPTAYPPEGPRE
jgi:hypothetical protein